MLHEQIKATIQKAKQRSSKTLNLSNAGLDDSHIIELLKCLSELDYVPHKLNLDDNSIGDLGFEQLINFQGITEINLDRNNITNNGLIALTKRQNNSLSRVNLSRNALCSTDESIIKLIRPLIGEIFIEIDRGNNISYEEIKQIKDLQIDIQLETSSGMVFSDINSKQAFEVKQEGTDSKKKVDEFMDTITALLTDRQKLYHMITEKPQVIEHIVEAIAALDNVKREMESNASIKFTLHN